MLTFTLTLVRHGETQYNKDKLLQGQGVDTPLSEPGQLQAQAAGLYLRDIRFSNVFVSNLQRARQTAEIIMRNNIHSSEVEMVFDPLLRERGFGIAEGRPKEDLKNMANASGQSCRDYTPPGGETLEQVRLRCKKFLKALYQRMVDDHCSSGQGHAAVGTEAGAGAAVSETDVPPAGLPDDGMEGIHLHALVVSHGAYIRVAVRHFVEDLQCTLPQVQRMSQVFSACPNTGISRFILTLSPGESGPVPSAVRCVFTNRRDHLTSRDICYIKH
ncbi:fructose-2,6-bisphosphatase TIGAR B isoform X2 [Esox lucius]|uniref:fructose-2,6-bisphosphate 2-phosphatase n=1 Tax=Esox lucius TaxID=8010 RepID=A0A3P8ZG52_ESOLU|nr:fructose-2,6-bisphosphatase TIGAR B isoform X2 [Esox lucius]